MQHPNILLFILHIAGAASLLIWSVRLVRTGVERAFSVQLRQWLRRSSKSRVLAAISGTGAAIMLQSSTAVAILVSNFVSKGNIATFVGLGILLGADVGSAIVAQLLLVRQTFLIPLLLVVGVGLFLRSQNGRARQVGRVLIGLALIFVSLDMIRSAAEPLIDSPGTVAAMQYLGTDAMTAFAIGAVFAWAVHSSVAAVLLFVTLVAQGLLPATGAVAMVLGANLGGAFIAYVLTLSAPVSARQMVVANLALRGGGAAVALVILSNLENPLVWLGRDGAQQTINLHLAFNLVLALIAMPLLGPIARLTEALMPSKADATVDLDRASILDTGTSQTADQSLTLAAREILHIGEMIETMLRAAGPLYQRWDGAVSQAIKDKHERVRARHQTLKLFLARLNRNGLDDDQSKKSNDLASIASNLEAASDAIARNLTELARRLDGEGVTFSTQGSVEISDFHDRVLTNVQLGLNVLMTQNPDAARELVAAKEKVRTVEQHLQREHLGRLREGLTESIETSSIHQETLRVLKQINTSFSLIGYPILSETGDLLASRLSDEGDR
ncbi:Na/Pi cotransporter family protein [Oceaniglobus ichthyenteri]|uniref:Na/Pi cotransporter family protein n=1 Tax=Oceaniglobus ichthyenteri TaxID=2136177 RepID=UPI00197D34BE|nr:Na/Pi cotransporter family protein [Oceaniglobus ichthyenteri]